MTFKVGDVVRLKSGGYPMTVAMDQLANSDSVSCVWHDADGRISDWYFQSDTLISADTVAGIAAPCAIRAGDRR